MSALLVCIASPSPSDVRTIYKDRAKEIGPFSGLLRQTWLGQSQGMAPTYLNFIDGAWVPSVSGNLFEDRNPADASDVIGLFPEPGAPP
jgi:hypothetical protein